MIKTIVLSVMLVASIAFTAHIGLSFVDELVADAHKTAELRSKALAER